MEHTSSSSTVHRNNMLRQLLDNQLKDISQKRARVAADIMDEMLNWRQTQRELPRTTGYHSTRDPNNNSRINTLVRELSDFSFLTTPGGESPRTRYRKQAQKLASLREIDLRDEDENVDGVKTMQLPATAPPAIVRREQSAITLTKAQQEQQPTPVDVSKTVSFVRTASEQLTTSPFRRSPVKQVNIKIPIPPSEQEQEQDMAVEEENDVIDDDNGDGDDIGEEEVNQLLKEMQAGIHAPRASSLVKSLALTNYVPRCQEHRKAKPFGRRISCPITSAAARDMHRRRQIERMEKGLGFLNMPRSRDTGDKLPPISGNNFDDHLGDPDSAGDFFLTSGIANRSRINVMDLARQKNARKLCIEFDRRNLRAELQQLVEATEREHVRVKRPKRPKTNKFKQRINALLPQQDNHRGGQIVNNNSYTLPFLIATTTSKSAIL